MLNFTRKAAGFSNCLLGKLKKSQIDHLDFQIKTVVFQMTSFKKIFEEIERELIQLTHIVTMVIKFVEIDAESNNAVAIWKMYTI